MHLEKYMRRLLRQLFSATLLLCTMLASFTFVFSIPDVLASSQHPVLNTDFNKPGNLLITDQFNNRVIEVNRHKKIVWNFGSGNPALCNPGPDTIIGPNDAERLAAGFTLIAGTGIPAGASSALPNGCVDNRVIIVDAYGHIVWQYGQAEVSGSGPNQLNVPVFAIQLPDLNILIVDQANNRIIEVNFFTKKVIWSYGPGAGPGALNNPNSAELLPNGHILIADENNNRVIEITRSGNIVWQYSSGLQIVAFASRLTNGDTLITDSGHSRILEINQQQKVIWQYFTNTDPNSNSAPSPTNAVRLRNGDTAIADQFNNRAIIVDKNQQIDFQYGITNVVGNGYNQLNAPYTAFVVGDYTGQTPPPFIDQDN
jgi:PQQ-like domain